MDSGTARGTVNLLRQWLVEPSLAVTDSAKLSFLIPSYVLAGILTSTLGTLAYGLVVNLIMLLLPVIAPDRVPGVRQDAESGHPPKVRLLDRRPAPACVI